MTRKGRPRTTATPQKRQGQISIDEIRSAFSGLYPDDEPQDHDTEEAFVQFVEDLPTWTPQEIFDQIGKHGYVAQDGPRRSLSLMAFRHVQRIRHFVLHKIHPSELPPKSNYLLIGPTGSGKTFLIELLFRHILKLPTVLVDITNYSETGYVGQDVTSILTRLLYASENSLPLAEIGVVCLDEFDKIASGQNNAVFAGAGTTKDISGLGVQRELLKLLESTTVTIPTEFSHSSYQQFLMLSTANIPFLACGAFSGFKLVSQALHREPRLGFTRQGSLRPNDGIAVSYTQEEVEQTRYFQQYGFLPELIARFDRIVPFSALDEDALSQILRRNLVSSFQKEFALAGISLHVDESLLHHIVRQALKRETGARGLRSVLAQLLEDTAFRVYSEKSVKSVRIAWTDHGLHVEQT